jgi:glycosyltransferase involved in cell wall biosynthesis
MACRIGFVTEQSLGHITHAQNLAAAAEGHPDIEAQWLPISYEETDLWSRLPFVRRNWSLQLSLRARQRVQAAIHQQPLDGLFFHTQVLALSSLPLMLRLPTVVSLDATPRNMDRIGKGYDHIVGSRWSEHLKFVWNRAVFRRASALTTWSRWARNSLIDDYGIEPETVMVVYPGVDPTQWRPQPRSASDRQRPRLLFVGGDFARKGGPMLLEIFREALADRCELDIVTRDASIPPQKSLRVHPWGGTNNGELRQLFADADLFVLPTLADTNALVVLEAMASGLPVVATNLAAIPEEVEHGVSGLLVPPADPRALLQAITCLLDDPARLRAMGQAGRRRVERHFDARRNYRALLDLTLRAAHYRATEPPTNRNRASSVHECGTK